MPDKRPVIAMLVTGMLLMLANMSIEPIITVYVAQLVPDPAQVTFVAGVVMSAAALGSILSASRLGKLADRIGHWKVIIGCLAGLGGAADPAGLRDRRVAARRAALPDGPVARRPAALHRQRHPPQRAGRATGSMLGYSTSSQYAGQVVGPLAGGFVGGHIGMRAVFLGTSVLMAAGAVYDWLNKPRDQG